MEIYIDLIWAGDGLRPLSNTQSIYHTQRLSKLYPYPMVARASMRGLKIVNV